MEAVRQRARIAWVTVLSLIAAVIAGVLPLAAHRRRGCRLGPARPR